MQSREQRHGQSNRNEDLSDFIGTAWYVARHVVRHRRGQGQTTSTPSDPLFSGGIGAIELGVRYEQLRFESASKTGTASPIRARTT